MEGDKFDNVHWITAYKAIDVIKLQDGFASALKFNDIENIEDRVIWATKYKKS